jgi:PST family polysaccharide transporter
MLNTFCTVSRFLIAAYWGKTIEAVAWSWDITLAINFVNTYFIMHFFTLKENAWPYYKALLPQCLNSLIVFVTMYLVMPLNINNVVVNLLFKSLSIFAVTLIMAQVLHQYKLSKIVSFIFQKR